MELILQSKNKTIGLDDGNINTPDITYFSLLPKFKNSIGIISKEVYLRLNSEKMNLINKNKYSEFKINNGNFLTKTTHTFITYKINSMSPILYETWGYNCILNSTKTDQNLDFLNDFLINDNNFNKEQFNILEKNCNYLIRSYHDGGASTIFVNCKLLDEIIETFNSYCNKTNNKELNINNLNNPNLS
tara:strand:+ start:220 stop:783 length:564 start_codon:yes stop_codon:yes gene_type:complete